MSKKEIKALREKFMSEEITLPESLSAENIEKLVDNNRIQVVHDCKNEKKRGNTFKKIVSVAAVIALVCGIFTAAGFTANDIALKRQDNIIQNKTENSDTSEVENLVLSYYKTIYNNAHSIDFNLNFGFGDKDTAMDIAPEVYNSSDASTSVMTEETAGNFSTTNVQVQGVDEADIIKTDGKYIYFLSNNEVNIVDARDPEKMIKTAVISLREDNSGYGSEMYVYGDKLVVIQRVYKETASEQSNAVDDSLVYDCCCMYIECDTLTEIYDISDRSKPEKAYEYKADGEYISSRMLDGRLITVSAYNIPYYSIANDRSFENFESSCDEMKKAAVPSYSVNSGEYKQVNGSCIKILNENEPTEYIVISDYDLNNGEKEPAVKATVCGSYEFYCTETGLFLSEYTCGYWENGVQSYVTDDTGTAFIDATRIHKFDITDEGVLYNKSATVGGTPLNQFSMDEYNGTFRIVTNGYNEKTSSRCSMVYVLDKNMNIIGKLDNIAEDEEIKSSRFLGDTLYLVTFYQTDPLFVIDLSDPTNPEISGELKIPGFSSYLHPIAEGYVIGVGSGGTENGTDGSAKVSLFDVSDPKNPKEISVYTVPDAYFDSSHKAFTVVDGDTFALCIRKYGSDANYNYKETQSIMLFDVENGEIKLHGDYKCKSFGQYYSVDNIRSVFIGNTIFAVSDCGIISYGMEDNGKLGEISFIDPD